ncbi:hypothetical protein LPB86_18015 [Pedobacter sp. MC2016-14]|uniref:hypothetical protein n=1 Tax=Pedobacter sp. MC2016-14 TaxID=2897327 RepID=UPI001E512ECE|nr:hypothetical protein [Pedobacter sp. MC2016-14]MCD0490142.1 hypothetical protein [Pedobacter sp. MC2016-14]
MRQILTFPAILLLILFALITGCSSKKNIAQVDTITLSGKVEQLGMTTFQYGTHLLNVPGKTYALKSSKLDLNKYIDQSVTIKGTKTPGYPIEGGPELIEVLEILAR